MLSLVQFCSHVAFVESKSLSFVKTSNWFLIYHYRGTVDNQICKQAGKHGSIFNHPQWESTKGRTEVYKHHHL